MLLTCRATVFSDRNSVSAIAPVGRTGGQQLQHLAFACRQRPVVGRRAGQRGKVGHGTEVVEHRSCGSDLHPLGVAIAEAAADLGDQDPGARGLVRCVDLLPGAPGCPQLRQRRLAVTFGEQYRASGACGHGMYPLGAGGGSDFVEFRAAVSRSLDVTGVQRDLDPDREQRRAMPRPGVLDQGTVQARGRRSRLAGGQP